MEKWKQNTALFGIGAVGYSLIEIAARGYTHWTMTLTGGICAVSLYHAHRRLRERSVWFRCVTGAAVITAAELAVGLIVNRMLRWNVWDYSDRFMNLFGQICLQFSTYWFGINLLLIPMFNILDGCVFKTANKAKG